MAKYKKILITGGAGFVGANLAIRLKEYYQGLSVTALDNLYRSGSELNVPRLKKYGIKFFRGDVRRPVDLNSAGQADLLIECSAEPSVLAGLNGSPEYLIGTNLSGTINCLELARKKRMDIMFLSTSRVYPWPELNSMNYIETPSRYKLSGRQQLEGASRYGIAESFALGNLRSLYGATKLASEHLIQEYNDAYKIRTVINRCGVITGPWQMGKVDQGFIVYWMSRHFWRNSGLSYLGFEGSGKQVRDFLHVDDLFEVMKIQMNDFQKFNGQVFNIGGGFNNSVSLRELTAWCQKITGNRLAVKAVKKNRPNDVRIYISDCRKFEKITGWSPRKDTEQTLMDIFNWLSGNENRLKKVLK